MASSRVLQTSWHKLAKGAPYVNEPVTHTGNDSAVNPCLLQVFVRRNQCMCRLTGTDIYSFDQKIDHIARHVRLPDAPRLGPGALQGPHEDQIPPILIINVQLPTYSVSPLHRPVCKLCAAANASGHRHADCQPFMSQSAESAPHQHVVVAEPHAL